MNKDKAKGKLKDIVGGAERKLGKVTGNRSTEVRGMARQAEGKVQQMVGKVKDNIGQRRGKVA